MLFIHLQVIPTIDTELGVQCEFFETDDTLRTTNSFTVSILPDQRTIQGDYRAAGVQVASSC
jgi:hypothetical protein